MDASVHAHFPNLNKKLSEACIETFYRLRGVRGIEKKPATRELINWIRILLMDKNFDPKHLSKNDIPYLGVLIKKSEDFKIVQRQIAGTH
jgi:hypothetical protein